MKKAWLIIMLIIEATARVFTKYIFTAFVLAAICTGLFYYQFWGIKVEKVQAVEQDNVEVVQVQAGNTSNPIKPPTDTSVTKNTMPQDLGSMTLDEEQPDALTASRPNPQLVAKVSTVKQVIFERIPFTAGHSIYLYFVYGILLLTIIGFIWQYYRQPKETNVVLIDMQDPPELFDLFEKHADIIKDLGTPRKIKRFCNRIRFQYNMLSKDNGLPHDLAYYFSLALLLESEKKRALFLLPYDKFETAVCALHDKKPRDNYEIFTSCDGIIPPTVLPNLYRLNRNVLV